VIDFVESHLHSGQVFADVGAWFGIYTLLAADLVDKMGKVYAFEPDPKARDFLEKNLKINQKINVEVLPFAVSSDSVSKWITNQPASSLTRVYSAGENHTQTDISVGAVTLDDFFKDRKLPDMIKIDVEGHEVEVVEGGLRTLSNPSTTIILELHSLLLRRRGLDVSKFIQRIEALRGTKSVCLEGDPMAPGMPPHLIFA
jgi:FkbM family methyltransferase